MVLDLLQSFFIIGYSQLNFQDDDTCGQIFSNFAVIFLYYWHAICLIQSFFVLHFLYFLAPFINAIFVLDIAEDEEPKGFNQEITDENFRMDHSFNKSDE